jgi:Sodium:solute symporter family
MNTLQIYDYLVFLVYLFIVAGYGYYVYKRKQTKSVSASQDYFLAEGSLTWWAIGTSLIASNISSEQFIAMSGNGFKMGLAIATYEWMAALTLIIVAVFFIPVYLKNKIYTMPQFLSERYDGNVAMIMAVFLLLLYVIVNLTSILYLGALAINGISGIQIDLCMYGLAFFAIVIALGGMKVIGYTDVIQVVFLIFGGLVTTYLALDKVAELNGGSGMVQGFNYMFDQSGDHFHMILNRDNPSFPSLPGLTVLLGGMWIVNLNYWGCNQDVGRGTGHKLVAVVRAHDYWRPPRRAFFALAAPRHFAGGNGEGEQLGLYAGAFVHIQLHENAVFPDSQRRAVTVHVLEFAEVLLPDDFSAEIQRREIAGRKERNEMRSVAHARGRGPTGERQFLGRIQLRDRRGPRQRAGVGVEAMDDHIGVRVRREKNTRTPDNRRRAAFARHFDGPDDAFVAPLRPNPVAQQEMDAGSVELF